jgi:hypothetical protein
MPDLNNAPSRQISQAEIALLQQLSLGAGPWPGFGGAPPAVQSTSLAGVSAVASRSDHTHALDVVAYNPSIAGMQATGLVQQTYAAPTATPAVLNVASGRVPFGAAGVLTTAAGVNFDSAQGALCVGPQATDSLGDTTRLVATHNVNSGKVGLLIANSNAGNAVSSNLLFLAGSFDGSAGANTFLTLNGQNVGAGLGGPQLFTIVHTPSAGVAAALRIQNFGNVAGADITFVLQNGAGGLREGGRFINGSEHPILQVNQNIRSVAGNDLQLGSATGGVSFSLRNADALIALTAGLTAAGAVAVNITNAPAGVGATPAEYLQVKGTGGATRYIPLLG